MKRPRGRTILKVIALLAVGAAFNVAVAWGCSMWCSIPPLPSITTSLASVPNDLQELLPSEWLTWAPPSMEAMLDGDTTPFRHRSSYLTFHHGRSNSFGLTVSEVTVAIVGLGRGGDGPLIVHHHAAGWPLRSLTCEGRFVGLAQGSWQSGWTAPRSLRARQASTRTASVFQNPIPLRPLWPDFAINTVFYVGLVWMIFFAPSALRRRLRSRRGQCPACGYPIGLSAVCTECGAPVGHHAKSQALMGAGDLGR